MAWIEPDHQLQQFRRHVAVADEDVLQPQADRLARRVQGVLGEDRRLGVGVRDRCAAIAQRRPCDVGRPRRAPGDLAPRTGWRLALHPPRSPAPCPPACVPCASRWQLGDLPVLAEGTAEVAPRGGDGIGTAARLKMKERLLLDRVDVLRDRPLIDQRHQRPIPVLTHATRAQLARRNDAAVRAKIAAHPQIIGREAFPQDRIVAHGSNSTTTHAPPPTV